MRGKSLKFAGGAVIGTACLPVFLVWMKKWHRRLTELDIMRAEIIWKICGEPDIMKCLDGWEQHTNDNYHLGTIHSVAAPNDGDNRNPAGDCQGANGQTDIPGSAVMNCTGFVRDAMYKASGMDHDTAYATIPSLGGMGGSMGQLSSE